MKQAIGYVVAGVALSLLAMVVWTFKGYIVGAITLYVVAIMVANAAYKKATGKDMALYVRMMGGTR